MMEVKYMSSIPDLVWSEYSQQEFNLADPETIGLLERKSYDLKMFMDGKWPLLVAGLYRASLLGPSYLWTLITPKLSEAKPSIIRALLNEITLYGQNMETLVNVDNPRAIRFAKLFGFNPSPAHVDIGGIDFQLYRRY